LPVAMQNGGPMKKVPRSGRCILDNATTVAEQAKNMSGSVLARNFWVNLLGQTVPLLVAILTLRRIIECIGTDRIGVLSLTWVVIGYFSLFDFGLSRALTNLVAEKIGTDRDQDIPSLVSTLVLLLGVLGAAIVGLLTPAIVYRALNAPHPRQFLSTQREAQGRPRPSRRGHGVNLGVGNFHLGKFGLPLTLMAASLRAPQLYWALVGAPRR